MMVGPGGVGKSSLLHALMNKLLPLANSTQLADLLTVKPQREQQSTTEQLLVSATDDEKPWVKVTEDDEIDELVGLVLLVANVSEGLTKSSRFLQFLKRAVSYAAHQLHSANDNVDGDYCQQISSIKNKVVGDVLSRAAEQAKKNPRTQAPEFEALMRVWDCAGQSVYLDILSAFLTPKTMFMLLYDARKDLNDRCITLSHQNGQVTQEQKENISYIEMLSQWMATIQVILTDKASGSIPDYPRVITVGTHGDDPQVSSHKDDIIKKLYSKFESKAFIHLVGKGFIVNNTSAGKGDDEDPTFKELRKEVHRFMNQSSVTIATPVSWVLFQKVLDRVAQSQPVLTYEEALEVAVSCSIPPDSFNSVLKFYHDVAVFLHYIHIPSMKDYVIASPQWLVKQIAKVLALEGFEVCNPALWKPLREKGILVEPLYREVWKGSCLPEQAIMDLLERCLLAAPIDTKQKLHKFPGVEYLVPSAVPLCSDDQLKVPSPDKIVIESSLHLLFSTGYVPPGYLTRLVVALSKENKCQISFSHGIYRDRFTFLHGEQNNKIDKITVTQNVTSVMISITRLVDRKSHNLPFSLTCREVLNTILACSSDVRQWLPSIQIHPAFACEACSTKDHFIEIPAGATTQSQLTCQNDDDKICNLTPTEKLWLTISAKEEGLDSTGTLTTAELQAVAQEVQSKGKLKELADSLEVAIHYKSNIEGSLLLDRWQKEMNQFNLHARSHLVHHLRCVNLNDIAERLKYDQLELAAIDSSIDKASLTIPQDPLTEADMLSSSRLMGDGDLEELASALRISDDDLATVQSRFKKKESQAHELLCKWHTETRGSKQQLCGILKYTGYHEAAAKCLQGSETPSLKELLRRVKTTKWYRLGLELDIDNYTMEKIEADAKQYPSMTEAALTRVFQVWLRNKENPSWSDVDKALKVMGDRLYPT